jgi:hypothetical protein
MIIGLSPYLNSVTIQDVITVEKEKYSLLACVSCVVNENNYDKQNFICYAKFGNNWIHCDNRKLVKDNIGRRKKYN